MKNNDTFTIEDDFYLAYGPQMTEVEAKSVTAMQWKIIKKQLFALKSKLSDSETPRIIAEQEYYGHLWKYQPLIKQVNRNPFPKDNPTEAPTKIKRPKGW